MIYRADPVPLEPNAAYALIVSDGEDAVTVPFQTGSSTWQSPPLEVAITGLEVLGETSSSLVPIGVSVEAPESLILYWDVAPVAAPPNRATLATGGPVYETFLAEPEDGYVCASVQAENLEGARTPWVTACVPVEAEIPPTQTDPGEPYEPTEPWSDTGTPYATTYPYGYYYYSYGTYYDSSEFVLFSCGGCSASPQATEGERTPWLASVFRRRRAPVSRGTTRP